MADKTSSQELRDRIEDKRALRRQWKEAAEEHVNLQTQRFAGLHAKFSDLADSDEFPLLKIMLNDDNAYFSFDSDAEKAIELLWRVEPNFFSGNTIGTGRKVFIKKPGFRVIAMKMLIPQQEGEVKTTEESETFPNQKSTWEHVLRVISDQIVWRDK